jgi:hypothetical protein
LSGAAAAGLRERSFTIDGEAVLAGADDLARRSCGPSIFWNSTGEDIRSLPFSKRKAQLARLFAERPQGLALNEHLEEEGAASCRSAFGHVGFVRIDRRQPITRRGLND